MKKVYMLSLFIVMTGVIHSQTLKYTDMRNITSRSYDEYSEYVASDGYTYKIGGKVKFGQPANNKMFMYILEGDGILTIHNAPARISGNEVEIKRISVCGSKRTGYYVSITTKGFYFLINCFVSFEEALACGEVIGYGKTSDQALTELKSAKEKLDLELITRNEFDSIKAELSKYIK